MKEVVGTLGDASLINRKTRQSLLERIGQQVIYVVDNAIQPGILAVSEVDAAERSLDEIGVVDAGMSLKHQFDIRWR